MCFSFRTRAYNIRPLTTQQGVLQQQTSTCPITQHCTTANRALYCLLPQPCTACRQGTTQKCAHRPTLWWVTTCANNKSVCIVRHGQHIGVTDTSTSQEVWSCVHVLVGCVHVYTDRHTKALQFKGKQRVPGWHGSQTTKPFPSEGYMPHA